MRCCTTSSSSSSSAAAPPPPPATQELPRKLQEIVRMFQSVTEPRAKCEQLLLYASKLKPLAEEHKQPENRVEGCVSNVYIVCEVKPEDGRVYLEAESDVLLTKGLAGLLVEGLSGVMVEEVLNLTPEFVHMLGLKQSLTPSRSNGFLNMLKLIQKKTSQLNSNYVSPSTITADNAHDTVPITSIKTKDDRSDTASLASEHPALLKKKKHVIEKKKLTEGLTE